MPKKWRGTATVPTGDRRRAPSGDLIAPCRYSVPLVFARELAPGILKRIVLLAHVRDDRGLERRDNTDGCEATQSDTSAQFSRS